MALHPNYSPNLSTVWKVRENYHAKQADYESLMSEAMILPIGFGKQMPTGDTSTDKVGDIRLLLTNI